MTLHDLAPIIHARRTALGLSQDRLAKLCGLSRATVNQLENGTLVDLGAAKLLALLALLGLELNAHRKPAPLDALALLSQTASVSYKRVLQPAELARALAQGDLPEAITPHIATVLDEAPLALILAAVEQAARATRTPPKTLWKHLVQWAHALQSPTPAWA
jgi:transcriptional regulator with XRE-family HTH domain